MKEFNFEKELLSVQDELFRFAYKLTADREKAEDLLQDTLLKAMLHKESYNKNTNFKGWLFIIMRNTFINGYRAEVGHTRLYISSDPAYYSRIMDESRTEEVDRNYDLEKIRNAIKSRPESHFIPFEMYPVSYTHLDVYKRQVLARRPCPYRACRLSKVRISVSYTHLDVYKRQTLKRWVMILIMIIVQISILTSTIDTKGPLLNLLSVQSLRNSAELFFFMMMAHRNGDMTRKMMMKPNKFPSIPGKMCIRDRPYDTLSG